MGVGTSCWGGGILSAKLACFFASSIFDFFYCAQKRELGWVGEKGYRGCVKENLSGQTFLTSNLFPGGMNPASSTVSCCELVS